MVACDAQGGNRIQEIRNITVHIFNLSTLNFRVRNGYHMTYFPRWYFGFLAEFTKQRGRKPFESLPNRCLFSQRNLFRKFHGLVGVVPLN